MNNKILNNLESTIWGLIRENDRLREKIFDLEYKNWYLRKVMERIKGRHKDAKSGSEGNDS